MKCVVPLQYIVKCVRTRYFSHTLGIYYALSAYSKTLTKNRVEGHKTFFVADVGTGWRKRKVFSYYRTFWLNYTHVKFFFKNTFFIMSSFPESTLRLMVLHSITFCYIKTSKKWYMIPAEENEAFFMRYLFKFWYTKCLHYVFQRFWIIILNLIYFHNIYKGQ